MTVIGTTTAIAMTDEFLPFPVFTKKKKKKRKRKHMIMTKESDYI